MIFPFWAKRKQSGFSKMDMKQISSLLAAVALLLLCGGCGQDFHVTREKAEQGDVKAQFRLGVMYADGKGVPKNYVEAAKWFRKAADQGDVEAQHELGYMYNEGKGVLKNYAEAAKWFRKAAEQGDANAQKKLGLMYGNGEDVPMDRFESYAWFLLAKANGYEFDSEFNSEKISDLEKRLTVEQIEQGQARALELHRLYGKQSER